MTSLKAAAVFAVLLLSTMTNGKIADPASEYKTQSASASGTKFVSADASKSGRDASGTSPLSATCKRYKYSRYVRVDSLKDMYKAIKDAEPFDMIEVMAGKYYVARSSASGKSATTTTPISSSFSEMETKANTDAFEIPGLSLSGTIANRHGRPGKLITICGSKDTIFDGTLEGGKEYNGYAFRVVSSSYIRVAGFTLQNGAKGLDVQDTRYSEFKHMLTRDTLQEGIRIRYNSSANAIENNRITNTGRMWAGYGEGIYVGTSKRNSVLYGMPPDSSNNNAFRENVFGPGVTAENIDVKEFTTGGKIVNNRFDGSDIQGINGAASWVSLKGNGWTAYNNTGFGLKPKDAAGFRITYQWAGQAKSNRLLQNRCYEMGSGSYCVFITPGAINNLIGCTNIVRSWSRATIKPQDKPENCNCLRNCEKRGGGKSNKAGLRSGGSSEDVVTEIFDVPGFKDEEEYRPIWD